MKILRLCSFISTFLVICHLTTVAQEPSQGQLSQQDIDEQNRLSDPEEVKSTSDMIDEWKEETLQQLGVEEGVTADGKYIVFASANVSLKDTDPQYGLALANAFDVAMMEAQGKMLMDRFGRIMVDKTRETFRDQSTNAKEIPLDAPAPVGTGLDEKGLRIIDKMMSVVEADLDKALNEYGIPRNEYVSLPSEKKKILFKNALMKETLKAASGEIAGLFPVQTTVKKDKKGNTQVGVLLIMSPKSVQVATDIRLQRNSLVHGKGVNLKAKMVPKSREKWIGQLGTRLVYDQDGTPAIVSYGMGSYIPDGDDDYINQELKEEARKQAMDNADAQIAEVVAGQMSMESSRIQEESIEKAVSRQMTIDSATIEKTTKEIINQSHSFAKSRAKMEMKGLSTLASKFVRLPSGQEMCFVIRVWSYSGLNAVKNLNLSPAVNSGVMQSDKGSGVEAEYDGFLVNEVDDF